MGNIAVERQSVAVCEVIAFAVDFDRDRSLLDVQELACAVAVRLAVMPLTRLECPVPQLNHIWRLRSRNQHTLAPCVAGPEDCALSMWGELCSMWAWGLNQGRKTEPECVRKPQQSTYARIHQALLDIHKHAAAHPSELGELIECPSSVFALLLDPRADHTRQRLCTHIHVMHNSALLGHCLDSVTLPLPA